MIKKIKIVLMMLATVLISLTNYEVKASNYQIKELIPPDITTTIKGNYLTYKGIYYNNGRITIEGIKNISEEKRSITISIGFFDKNKRNIGILNYCSTDNILDPNEELDKYEIIVPEDLLPNNKRINDIEYFSVLGENINCRLDGKDEYIGYKVEDIYRISNDELSQNVRLLINILKVIAAVLVLTFIYKFLFTNSYRNMNSEDVRKEYDYINKELKKEREEKRRKEKPKPKVVKTHKTKEIIEQEKIENSKKEESNLRDFYK